MSILKVVKVMYDLQTTDGLTIECPTTLSYSLPDFDFILQDNVLTCLLNREISEISEAKSKIEPILRAWEIDSAISSGREEFRFIYKCAEIVDLTPLEPGSINTVVASASITATASMSARAHIIRHSYPTFPQYESVPSDIEVLWFRFKLYKQGRDQLQSMAYFCMSYMEGLISNNPSKEQFCNTYFFDRDVRNKLGDLISDVGDKEYARKGTKNTWVSLTVAESNWIEACTKILIRRLWDIQNGKQVTQIAMKDLPSI